MTQVQGEKRGKGKGLVGERQTQILEAQTPITQPPCVILPPKIQGLGECSRERERLISCPLFGI